jgi:hypothetical protein
MFVTQPEHEFSIAFSFGESGLQRWRVFELGLHAMWFVLTIEVPETDVTFRRTLCVSWDTDLVAILDSLDATRPIALLCMTPGWCSPTGQWLARSAREVWEVRDAGAHRVIVFRDESGVEFGDPSRQEQSQEVGDRRLVARLEAACRTCDTDSTDPAIRVECGQSS